MSLRRPCRIVGVSITRVSVCVYTRSEAERSLFLFLRKTQSLWSYSTRLRAIKVDAAETSDEQRVAVSGSACEDAAVRVADK